MKNLSEIKYKLEQQEDDLMTSTIDKYYMDKIIKPYKESEKVIDMHTHTNFSDGELSPQELIALAIQKQVGTIAITDHDTIDGIKQINKNDSLILDSGIKIIDGIELSAKSDKGTMHILGYNIDKANEQLNSAMIDLKNNSVNSVLSIMEQIKKDYGIMFGYEDIKNLINANHNLGRVDIAKLCVKYGYANSVKDAFTKYLVDAYNKTRKYTKKLNFYECLKLIKISGGIPVLAHPKSLELNETEFLILLKEMIKNGLEGIEVYHSSHTKEEMKYYLNLAQQYDLLVSGGSDYHGKSVKPDIELGSGKNNNIKIKSLSLLEKIH